MVRVFKRSAVLGVGFMLSGALVACSGGSGGESAEPPQGKPDQQKDSVSIESPKDASVAELCDLLPAQAATSLGLDPEGEIDDGPSISEDTPETCAWEAPDSENSVRLGPIEGRSIQEYYDNKSKFADYEELTIAGHPAVRANEGDPAKDGWCAMFVATDDQQMLYGFSRDGSKADTCGMAQKALEASVPTLPAAG